MVCDNGHSVVHIIGVAGTPGDELLQGWTHALGDGVFPPNQLHGAIESLGQHNRHGIVAIDSDIFNLSYNIPNVSTI